MEAAIQKADVLIEALGWIHRFREKVTVIKLGGSLLHNEDALHHVLLDVVFMEAVGMRPVIVHGGGKAISKGMEAAGIEPRFIQGRRYTDEKSLEIVKRVLAKEVNELLVEKIGRLEGHASPFSLWTRNVLFGERLTLTGKSGDSVDLGFVGHVTDVDVEPIRNAFSKGQVPVIPSICQEIGSEQILNVNADTAATAVAQKLGTEKLVYLSDVNGVRMDKDDADSRIQSLTASQAQLLIQNGNIDAGMIPKVEACLQTLKAGVKKVHVIDGNIRHSLLLEVYTTKGIGTEIVSDEK